MVLHTRVSRVYCQIIPREDSYDNCELSAGVTAVLSQLLEKCWVQSWILLTYCDDITALNNS